MNKFRELMKVPSVGNHAFDGAIIAEMCAFAADESNSEAERALVLYRCDLVFFGVDPYGHPDYPGPPSVSAYLDEHVALQEENQWVVAHEAA